MPALLGTMQEVEAVRHCCSKDSHKQGVMSANTITSDKHPAWPVQDAVTVTARLQHVEACNS